MVKLRENTVITLNADLTGGDVFLHYDRYFVFLNSSFCIEALHSGTYTFYCILSWFVPFSPLVCLHFHVWGMRTIMRVEHMIT